MVYSLGAAMYTLATNTQPFQDLTPGEAPPAAAAGFIGLGSPRPCSQPTEARFHAGCAGVRGGP